MRPLTPAQQRSYNETIFCHICSEEITNYQTEEDYMLEYEKMKEDKSLFFKRRKKYYKGPKVFITSPFTKFVLIYILLKVRNHDHWRGHFIGAAHALCNLEDKDEFKVPLVFHNASGVCQVKKKKFLILFIFSMMSIK